MMRIRRSYDTPPPVSALNPKLAHTVVAANAIASFGFKGALES